MEDDDRPYYITEEVEPAFEWTEEDPYHFYDVRDQIIWSHLITLWVALGFRIFYNMVLAKFWREADQIEKTGGNRWSHPCRSVRPQVGF